MKREIQEAVSLSLHALADSLARPEIMQIFEDEGFSIEIRNGDGSPIIDVCVELRTCTETAKLLERQIAAIFTMGANGQAKRKASRKKAKSSRPRNRR